jgi:glycosyltransferase involved in cell wall biosynthesis
MLGITEIAGFNAGLKRGLTELGVPVRLFAITEHPFEYGNEDTACVVRWVRAASARRRALPPDAVLRRTIVTMADVLARCLLVVYIAARFDVAVFVYGVTPLRGHELRLLRLLRTKVMVVFLGSDERPPYMSGAVLSTPGMNVEQVRDLTAAQATHVARLDEGATWVVSHHLSGHLHRKPFVPVLWLGLPVGQEPPASVTPAPRDRDVVRILHAPSSRTKGTEQIRAAIANLIAKGHAVEYEEIAGRPNTEVLAALRTCDFVVDELWSDTPMAALATEAAWQGRPAVVGGYGWDDLRAAIDAENLPPSMLCHPDELEVAIETLVTDRAHREELGGRAYQFVTAQWSARAVAERLIGLVTRTLQPATCDPQTITYPFGCGQPAGQVASMVTELVGSYGSSALAVDDKPALRKRLLDLVTAESPGSP